MVENVTMIYSKREKCEKCGADILIRCQLPPPEGGGL
jgi:hypothetical protein